MTRHNIDNSEIVKIGRYKEVQYEITQYNPLTEYQKKHIGYFQFEKFSLDEKYPQGYVELEINIYDLTFLYVDYSNCDRSIIFDCTKIDDDFLKNKICKEIPETMIDTYLEMAKLFERKMKKMRKYLKEINP